MGAAGRAVVRRLLLLDCDSTLSAIEGVDELARMRSPEVYRAAEGMTAAAMEGRIPLDEVFGRRLELIRPTRAEVQAVGRLYVERVEPTARAFVADAVASGWTPMILSGGFTEAIRPLAESLGIARVEAVDLKWDEAGRYVDFDRAYPTTRGGGKPEVIRKLRAELQPERIVMIGDGTSDLETEPHVDRFIGFGGYAVRARVRARARHFVVRLADALPLLDLGGGPVGSGG